MVREAYRSSCHNFWCTERQGPQSCQHLFVYADSIKVAWEKCQETF